MKLWMRSLICLAMMTGASEAGRIHWTATGTVTSTHGAKLPPLAGLSDEVQIEFSYQDSAPGVTVRDIVLDREPPLEPFVWTETEYREGVDLEVSIKIGAHTWEGTVASGSAGPPRTLEVRNTNAWPTDSASTDRFLARAAAEDGASFSSFPGTPEGTNNQLELQFIDRSEVAPGPDYLGSSSLVCVAQSIARITEARGSITNGSSEAIEFSIDPASITTEPEAAEPLELREISFADDQVTMRWPSVPGRFYLIQYLDEFLCWKEVLSVLAEAEETSESIFPVGFPKTQLYRVVELE